MYGNISTMALALIEGIALIVSPCIWPILPIILSGSVAGSKSRPLGIIFGFVLSFTIFTLFSRALIDTLNINPDLIRNISFILLLLLGLMMISTFLTEKFNLFTQGLVNVGGRLQTANNPQGGFLSGILFGCLIGIIWTPCAGPILAAVIVQVTLQQTTVESIFIILSFAIGAGLPMLVIAFTGRKLISHFTFLRDKTILIRKCLG